MPTILVCDVINVYDRGGSIWGILLGGALPNSSFTALILKLYIQTELNFAKRAAGFGFTVQSHCLTINELLNIDTVLKVITHFIINILTLNTF